MDFFSYYKAAWLIIAVSAALILFLVYLSKNNKVKKTWYYLPVLIYSFFTLLSSLFSNTPYLAFLGFPDRFEGLFVLLSYMIILFITINLINDKKDIKIILLGVLISAAILGVQGIFQYFGMDFFQSDLGRRLILPSQHHNLVNNLNFEFAKNIIYSTMFNPNYVGSYTAMLFSLTFALFILSKQQKYKLILAALNLIMFAYWLGSLSRAGLIGGALAVLFILLFARKKLKENWQYLLVLSIGFILIFTGMNYYGQGNIASDVLSFSSETEMAVVGETEELILEDIRTENKNLIIETNNNRISAQLTDNSLRFTDENGSVIPYSYDQNTGEIRFNNSQYADHNFKFSSPNNILNWNFANMEANFKITQDGFYIVGHNSKAYKIEEVDYIGFEGKERLGSSRGYIWSRSFSLLKDTWLIGRGADTYALHFPQEDWVGKLKAFGTTTKIVDKPHNLYLQIAINTGVPSLLAVLFLFGMYFYQSIKIYWESNYNDIYTITGLAVFAAFVGYAAAGFFNDSVVSVAPVFWILLGIGISINLKLQN